MNTKELQAQKKIKDLEQTIYYLVKLNVLYSQLDYHNNEIIKSLESINTNNRKIIILLIIALWVVIWTANYLSNF